jgi:hypothetical protein
MRSTGTNWRSSGACTAVAAIVLTQIFVTANAADINCLETRAALSYWRPISENARESRDPADAQALELVSCLASPNAELRDRIGYELFTFWLRNDKLTDDTRRSLRDVLSANLATHPDNGSDNVVLARSFSALILAELMRSDSNSPFMTASERQTLLNTALDSLMRENDYRGLDVDLGWVHPVAHMSDLLWRFTLHTETSSTQAESILDGIRSKVAPTATFYSFNESDRLARVVTTVIAGELVSMEKVVAWITIFEKPLSMEKWSDAFASQKGMAELHNAKLFLRALADQLDGTDIDPAISESLNELVAGFTQLI